MSRRLESDLINNFILQGVIKSHDGVRQPSKAATSVQNKPTQNSDSDIATLVQQDIEARAIVGKDKYGSRLTPYNGRSALIDAYQEVLDLAMYLRQLIEEENQK